jgi:putative redox protein
MGETKTMLVEHVERYAFVAKGKSNHYVVIDSEYDGQPAAACGPMEMILAALGSCTGSDVMEILRKKRQPVRRFIIRLEGERVEEHPRVYKRIQMKYVFEGTGLERKAIEQAIELSLSKYCSVHGMLSRSVEITHDVEVRETQNQ